MTRIIRFVIISFGIFCFAGGSLCYARLVPLTSEEKAWIAGHSVIRIGVPDIPPYEFINDSGEFDGMAADYLRLIDERTGIRFEVIPNLQLPEILRAVREGNVDMIPALAETEERRKFLSFSDICISMPVIILTRSDHADAVRPANLYGKTVAVESGFKTNDVLESGYPEIKKLPVASTPAALEAVISGKADAYIGGMPIATYAIRKAGLADMKINALRPYRSENIRFAVRRDQPELLNIVNKGLAGITPDEHDAIRRKWIHVSCHMTDWDFLCRFFPLFIAMVLVTLIVILVWNRTLASAVRQRIISEENLRKDCQELETRVEQAIQESEHRYRGLFENNHALMLLIDPETLTIADVNPAALSFYKCSREELVSMKITELNALKQDDILQDKGFVFSEERNYFTARHRLGDGDIRDVEIYSGPIRFEEKKFLLLILHDISLRKKTQKALQDSEERFRTLTSLTPVGIFMTDTAGDFLYVNPRWCEMAGLCPEDALRKGWLAGIHPDDRETVKNIWYEAVDTGENCEMEYRFQRPDGGVTWVRGIAARICSKNIEVTGYMGTVSDITSLKHALEALLESEGKYRQLFENESDALMVLDAETRRIEDVNRSAIALYGYSKEEFQALRSEDISEEPEKTIQVFEKFRAMNTGDHIHIPQRVFHHKNGHIFPGEVSVSKFRSGGRMKLIAAVRDISRRKQIEGQLRQSYKMEAIGTLAGGIAHDFNNILSAIIGYTELTMEIAADDDLLFNNLEQVLKAGKRARDLVQQILAFSRQSEQEFRPVQVRLVVSEALKLLRASIPVTIDIQSNIESRGLIFGDPTQIHQVMMNICSNAAHAMQENGGILKVTLEDVNPDPVSLQNFPEARSGKYVRLHIRDTGTGIPAEIMDRIFDPFFTTKEKGEGTGMGLSVVHGIVQNHGGIIQVSSNPGLGTAFDIFFPLADKTGKTPDDNISAPLPTGKETILFVDDEQPIVDIAGRMLESLGYHVTTRTSSVEALNLFTAHPERFDLVITDMTMPNMTGLDMACRMLEIRPEIPVILCTGFSARLNDCRTEAAGIRAVVLKPLLKRELAETIRKVLENPPKSASEKDES